MVLEYLLLYFNVILWRALQWKAPILAEVFPYTFKVLDLLIYLSLPFNMAFPWCACHFFMHRTCFCFCFWTEFHTPCWLLDVVVVIWSRHFFHVQYGRECSEDLHLHSVSSVVLVALGHRNFQPPLSKIFKAVLLPSWYFSVIVLLCLSPSCRAVQILQIDLYFPL